jgi:hypothetical protein
LVILGLVIFGLVVLGLVVLGLAVLGLVVVVGLAVLRLEADFDLDLLDLDLPPLVFNFFSSSVGLVALLFFRATTVVARVAFLLLLAFDLTCLAMACEYDGFDNVQLKTWMAGTTPAITSRGKVSTTRRLGKRTGYNYTG